MARERHLNCTGFVSLSGDLFDIPNDQYDEDVKAYSEAIENDDEDTMLHYETGMTGWKLID